MIDLYDWLRLEADDSSQFNGDESFLVNQRKTGDRTQVSPTSGCQNPSLFLFPSNNFKKSTKKERTTEKQGEIRFRFNLTDPK